MSSRWIWAGIFALLVGGNGCEEKSGVTVPPSPEGDTTAVPRPPDPGLSFTLGCLADLPVENILRSKLPPDAIPSIEKPRFLNAGQVNYLAPEDRIFGVEVVGRFLAFPRKIMNWHEIVTFSVEDTAGSVTASVTWCPLTMSFLEWRSADGPGNDRGRSLGVSGRLLDDNLVMYDRGTGTLWSQILGLGLEGPRQGECLTLERNTVDTTWDLWRRLHSTTVVLSNRDNGNPTSLYEINPYEAYWTDRPGPPEPVSQPDKRLSPQTLVLGVHGDGGSAAVSLRNQAVARTTVGNSPVVFFRDPDTQTTFAFENDLDGVIREFQSVDADNNGVPRFRDEESGSLWSLDGVAVQGPLAGRRLAQMSVFHVYWFAWATFFPGSPLLTP